MNMRTGRRGLAAIAMAVLSGTMLAATATPAHAMGTGDPYEDIQVGVTYTVYQPAFTDGIPTPKQPLESGDCPKGTEQNLAVAYGPKATPAFVVYEGNPICSDPGDGQQVASVKVKGATAKIFAYCPASQSCMRRDVKRLGGYLLVTLPAVSGLRKTAVEIQTAGQHSVTARKLIRIARSMQPVQ